MVSLFSLWLNKNVYMYEILIVHSSVDEHLGLFCFLAVVGTNKYRCASVSVAFDWGPFVVYSGVL